MFGFSAVCEVALCCINSAVPCCIMLCCILLCCDVMYSAVLCYILLCCAVLYSAVLYLHTLPHRSCAYICQKRGWVLSEGVCAEWWFSTPRDLNTYTILYISYLVYISYHVPYIYIYSPFWSHTNVEQNKTCYAFHYEWDFFQRFNFEF